MMIYSSTQEPPAWGDNRNWMMPLPDAHIAVAEYARRYLATVSDPYGTPRDGGARTHMGVDLMYRRAGRLDDGFVKGGTRSCFMPSGVPVLAARDGIVWAAGMTPRGLAVVLDHGKPWSTFYTHMQALNVPTSTQGKATADGSVHHVKMGDVIGYVGADPLDAEHVRHLHFETRYRGGASAAIDPESAMRLWSRSPAHEVNAARDIG